MKNITRAFFAILITLFTLFCLVACGSNTHDVNHYLEPKADFYKVTWNSIESATEYVVKINGKEYYTPNTSYPLYDHILPDETKMVSVKAVIEGVESKWEVIEYTAESVTEGLIYTRLDNGNYSVYCPSSAIPENGELVLPDTYEGEPVTIFRSEKLGFGLSYFTTKSTSDYNGPAYTGISKVRFPAHLLEIQDGALYKASVSELFLPDSVTKIGSSAFESCESLREVKLSNTLTYWGNFCFSDCAALKSIVLPDSVTAINGGVFARTGITKITLPDSVTQIESYAFYGCAELSEIEYSENVVEIGTEAFHNTLWYNSQPDGIVCHKHFFYDYKGGIPANTSLTFPAHVKYIAGTAMFKDEPNLVSVTFLDGFRKIPVETFFGCTNLKQVTLAEGLVSIGDGAFYGCPIEEITFPEGLEYIGATSTSIGRGAFENCTKLTSVTIPSSVRNMNVRCFYGCTSLVDVTIKEGIENIRKSVFAHCTALEELMFPESTTACYLTTVAYTGITTLVWPKNLDFNPLYALESGEGIPVTSLIIQKGTARLDYYYFFRCDGLKTIYFTGAEAEWQEVEIDRAPYGKFGNNPSVEAEARKILDAWESNLTVYFYSETEPAEEGNFWHYVDGVPTKW